MRMTPETEALKSWQENAVRVELEKIVASRHFIQSRRYPALLRYMVEATLRGETELLRERVIGLEVFGRQADYDTNADPIVRMTAAEVRKRLAQYYHEIEGKNLVQIEVQTGGYVPSFVFPEPTEIAAKVVQEHQEEPASRAELEPPNVIGIEEVHPTNFPAKAVAVRRSRMVIYVVLASAVLFAALALGWLLLPRSRPVDEVWAPLWQQGQPVTICIGQPVVPSTKPAQELSWVEYMAEVNIINFDDVQALTGVVTFLDANGRKFTLKKSTDTSLADLRATPVLLLGGLSNQWTLRALARLRYRMDYTATKTSGELRIYDSRNPTGRVWRLPIHQTSAQQVQDYALIARFTDQETGQPTIILAGLGGAGNKAAVEFLTQGKYLSPLLRALPSDKKNFEAVIGSSVVNGNQGQPQLLALETW